MTRTAAYPVRALYLSPRPRATRPGNVRAIASLDRRIVARKRQNDRSNAHAAVQFVAPRSGEGGFAARRERRSLPDAYDAFR